MNKKVLGSSAIALLIGLISAAAAQSPKTARIGLLGGMSALASGERIDIFRQQLQELGYFKTAKQIGLIPPNVLARADRVIK